MVIQNQSVQHLILDLFKIENLLLIGQKLVAATEGHAAVLCFKKTISSDHQYHVSTSSTSTDNPLTLEVIANTVHSIVEFEIAFKENRTQEKYCRNRDFVNRSKFK